jgi:hypothetical protein
MIGPTEPQDFYTNYWEKKPLHIKRGDPTYYKDVFSCKGGTISVLVFLLLMFLNTIFGFGSVAEIRRSLLLVIEK